MTIGQPITEIKPFVGLFTKHKHFEIWTQKGVLIITEQKHVEAIQKAIKEAKKLKINIKKNLKFMIDEKGILN